MAAHRPSAVVKRFQAMEIHDGLIQLVRRLDEGVPEDRAIAASARFVRGRFRPEMKDEAERRFRVAWAVLKGDDER